MGNYSFFISTKNGADRCRILWERMDYEKIQHMWLLKSAYEEDRPATLADLAPRWHDTKFVGYLGAEQIIALRELCRCLEPCEAFPRLYYEYEGWEELVCFEFHPGTEHILEGTFKFSDELKKENVPDFDEFVGTEEEWDALFESARQRVLARVYSLDGWKWLPMEP